MKNKNLVLKFDVVLYTTDLSIFKVLDGNRTLDKGKVNGFVEEFKIEQQPWIAIVNEKMEVIDGQHRIEAYRRLGLPVFYIIKFGYNLNNTIKYNKTGSIWIKPNYIHANAKLGIPSYLRLEEFMTYFPEFKCGVAQCIVANDFSGHNTKKHYDSTGRKLNKSEAFEAGLFENADMQLVYFNGSEIRKYKEFLPKAYHTGIFVKTMLLLFSKPKFDNSRMLHKLSIQPTKLKQCATQEQYLTLLTEIYNYSSRASEKIDLKYL